MYTLKCQKEVICLRRVSWVMLQRWQDQQDADRCRVLSKNQPLPLLPIECVLYCTRKLFPIYLGYSGRIMKYSWRWGERTPVVVRHNGWKEAKVIKEEVAPDFAFCLPLCPGTAGPHCTWFPLSSTGITEA